MQYIEDHENAIYVTGLTSNSRLMKKAESVAERAVRMYEKTRGKTLLFHSFYYQAGSWKHPRRAVARAEVLQRGKNVRFTVSNAEHAKAAVLYRQIYCASGEDELYIKDHKLYLKPDKNFLP